MSADALLCLFSEDEKEILNLVSDDAFDREAVTNYLLFYRDSSMSECAPLFDSVIDTLSSLSDEDFSFLQTLLPLAVYEDVADESDVMLAEA